MVNYNTFTQDDSVAYRAKAKEAGASAEWSKIVAAIALKDLGVEGAGPLAGPVLAVSVKTRAGTRWRLI